MMGVTASAPSLAADRDAVPRQPLPEPPSSTVRRIHSHDLLGAGDEIEIVHRSHVYRLRRTSLGKLILTK